jgi:inner membrane protein
VDNVTHTLVGLMMSRSGIDRKVAHAAPLMMIAANIPDMDVISLVRGPLSYLEWHRSYTHALASAPLMALIPPLILLFRVRFTLWAYVFSLMGVLSHLVLDWTNVYGIRMLLPLSARWLRVDMTDVVDPWILALLVLAVAAPAFVKLVSSEIASKTASSPKRGWACFALIALLGYEAARFAAHERALAVMGAHLYNGAIARRLTAIPTRSNPWRWRGVAEGDGFVTIVPVDLAGDFDPRDGRIDYSAPPSPAIDAARRSLSFQGFERFSQLPYWKTTPLTTGTLVELIDLRFGTPEHPGFEARAIVTASGEVREPTITFGAPASPLPTRSLLKNAGTR